MSKKHEMNVKEPYISMIIAGTKTVECRLFDSKRREIGIGDKILFTSSSDKSKKIEKTVCGLFLAENYAKLFEYIDVKNAGMESYESAVNTMLQFYDQTSQDEMGVIGIVLK